MSLLTMAQDNWQRHPDLYMPDGSMVLLADSTLFRVYPGLLAKHSNVFEGLTESSPHLPADAEMYDGCPLVRIPDDAEDVVYFLKATMGLCHFEKNQPMSFSIASAILRLSSKYMVQPLRRQAIEHFRRIIPQSYSEMDKVESYSQVFGLDPEDRAHPFQLLRLFQECRLLSFLPWMYYSVCALGFQKLVEGDTHNGKELCLDPHDARIALLGWKSLCTATRDIRNDTIMCSAQDCKGYPPCTDGMRLAWLQAATYQIGSKAMDQWGMFKLLRLANDEQYASAFANSSRVLSDANPCQLCSKTWLKQEENARNAIWSKLPAVFQLPAWETLRHDEEY